MKPQRLERFEETKWTRVDVSMTLGPTMMQGPFMNLGPRMIPGNVPNKIIHKKFTGVYKVQSSTGLESADTTENKEFLMFYDLEFLKPTIGQNC